MLPMAQLVRTFKDIVGDANVLTREGDTAYYRTGFRCGYGDASAVVFPTTLLEQWRVLQAAVDAWPLGGERPLLPPSPAIWARAVRDWPRMLCSDRRLPDRNARPSCSRKGHDPNQKPCSLGRVPSR